MLIVPLVGGVLSWVITTVADAPTFSAVSFAVTTKVFTAFGIKLTVIL